MELENELVLPDNDITIVDEERLLSGYYYSNPLIFQFFNVS